MRRGIIEPKAAQRKASAAITFPPSNAQKWTLPNGLTVIVQEDHSAPVACVQVWCAAGSITEDEHLGSGISHILEHMLFKGTETRPANAIAQAIQDVAGYINAYTSFDRTVYWIDVPKQGVSVAIDVLSDAMMNSTLPPEDYLKEQEVIRREYAMAMDDPDRVAGQLLFATAYQRHPYRLPVIGRMDIFNKLTRDDVMRYYKTRYVPNNLTFVIVGDVEGKEVGDQLGQIFGRYSERTLKPVFIPSEPPQLGRREIHQEFATELTRLGLAWHIPEATHPDVPSLDILSMILGEGRSSRLYRCLREEARLVYGVSSFSYTPGDPGVLGIDATVEPDKREAAQASILEIVDDVRKNGVTADEVTKAKKIALSDQLSDLTTMQGKASDLGINWMLTHNLDFSRNYLAAIQQVNRDEVQRVAAKYLADENLSICSLNPLGSLAGRDKCTNPIVPEEVQKLELSNGLRVLVREDPRLPLVAISAVFRGGLLAETPETNGITSLVAKTLLKGTSTRSAEQIALEIEAVGGEIDSEAGNNSFRVLVHVTQPDLHLGVEILADVLLNATFPVEAIEREKEVQFAGIRAEEEKVTTLARNVLRKALFLNHPYALRANGSEESVASLTRSQLVAFRDQFVVGRNGVISVFGNVKAAKVKELLEKRLATMRPGELALTRSPIPKPLPKTCVVERLKDKAQAVMAVGYQGADILSEDRHALELIDTASSDLGSRFFIRIREEMGLAYYVGATQMHGLVPGIFAFYLGTDPEKTTPVQAALLEEIEKLARDGLTEIELARAKKKVVGGEMLANQSNEAFGYMAALDELYGLGFDNYKKLPAEIEAVTLEDIKRVAAKYFRDRNYVLAMVRPPPKAPAAKHK